MTYLRRFLTVASVICVVLLVHGCPPGAGTFPIIIVNDSGYTWAQLKYNGNVVVLSPAIVPGSARRVTVSGDLVGVVFPKLVDEIAMIQTSFSGHQLGIGGTDILVTCMGPNDFTKAWLKVEE